MRLHSNNSQDAVIAQTLMSISGPVFAALQTDSERCEFVVHAAKGRDRSRLNSEILLKLAEQGLHKVKVVFHKPDTLARAKSLQALTSLITGGRLVYDPTGAVARARALVQASISLRHSLGQRAQSFLYAPLLRSLVVVLRKPDHKSGEALAVADMAHIEARVIDAVRGAFLSVGATTPSVRVGFSIPNAFVVPVDGLSARGLLERAITSARAWWKPAALAALVGLGSASPAVAQDPAVSEPNLKLKGTFGEVIDDYTWAVEGSFTAPIGERFGFAIDAGYADKDDGSLWGTGGHLFTRDPESYLLGLFAAYVEGNEFDIDVTRVGGEFELYFDNVTLGGHAGYQFSSALGDKAIGGIDFKWYATENFAITAGAFGDEDNSYGRGRLEWQPGFAALPGLAFNVEGVIGDEDYHSVMGGLTYYFGTPMNLKDRHRRQDPDSSLFAVFQSVQQERERLAAQYGPNPPQ